MTDPEHMAGPDARQNDTDPRGRAIVRALGQSTAIAGLFVVLSLALLGETVTTALWQSLFCFVAVSVLMLVGLYFTRAGRSDAAE